MAGQTISDRLLAAKYSLAGQGLAKSVCKATTEELMGPKKKHLDYLVHCTNEPNVSIPQLANLLIERSQNANWVVVFKALITVHHLMCYGNERFTQYLASSNSSFQLSNFLDKSGVQGYDMSPFIRRYARYLNEKALSYRTVAFDFCKVKRGKEDGVLRTMTAEKLLKTLPVLQSQLDALLEFDCTPADLSNGVINMAFMLLFRDLIRLFAGYNDSIINLLEKYFDMNRKQCKEALDLYKKFLIRMDRVGEFLKVAENVGIDKGEIPDLTKAPSSLLDALEQHLAALEGKKSATSTPTQSSSSASAASQQVKSGVTALNSTSSSFGTAAQNSDTLAAVDETVAKQIVAEEEAILNQYKAKINTPDELAASAGNLSATNPFLASPTQPIVDLFANAPPSSGLSTSNQASSSGKALDDLLQLGNPFGDFNASQQTASSVVPHQNGVSGTTQNNAWMTNGFGSTPAVANGIGSSSSYLVSNGTAAFVDDRCFTSVFGTNNASSNSSNSSVPSIGMQAQATSNKVLTGDLDSSLASLAENLSINKTVQQPKLVQWGSPAKTGNVPPVWTPQPMAATTGVNYRPMGMVPSNVSTGFPQMYPQMGMQNVPAGHMMGAPPVIPSAVPVMQPPQSNATPAVTSQGPTLDPFGAL